MGRPRKEVAEAKIEPEEETAESREARRRLEITMAAIEKQHGKGTLFLPTDKGNQLGIELFSSGSLKLDAALGGGYPRGRIIEIFGPESSGKTTLTLHAIAEVQRAGGVCAFIDAEHALDLNYAKNLGVNTAQLLICQPDTGEQALQIVDSLARSEAISLIIVDSVSALIPKAELEGEIGDSHVGLQARLMSQALRTLGGVASRSKTTIMFINQLRMKIGVMFGNPETTSGGNALKFFASQRIDIRRTGSNKDPTTGEVLSNLVKVKVVKNKIAPPFKEAALEVEFGIGVNTYAEILDLAVECGVVDKSGAWYSYGTERLGQGRTSVIESLKRNSTLFSEIKALVVQDFLGDTHPVPPPPESPGPETE